MPHPKGREHAKVRISEIPREYTTRGSIQPGRQDSMLLEESPEELTDYFQHITYLTEKMNTIKQVANESRQARRLDLTHTLDVSPNKEDGTIPAHILLGATPHHSNSNDSLSCCPAQLPPQNLLVQNPPTADILAIQAPGSIPSIALLTTNAVTPNITPVGANHSTTKHGLPDWANIMAATLADPNTALSLLASEMQSHQEDDRRPIFTNEAAQKNGMDADVESLPEAIMHIA